VAPRCGVDLRLAAVRLRDLRRDDSRHGPTYRNGYATAQSGTCETARKSFCAQQLTAVRMRHQRVSGGMREGTVQPPLS